MTITITVPPTSAQVEAIRKAGTGCAVHHPRAGTRRGRRGLIRALTEAGLSNRHALTLQWSTTGAPVSVSPEASPAAD